ncbi:MAG: GNAT family N-acetyltransferase/peptidase C39 family protein [Gammaproteobacteria bacterium]
MIRPATVQDLEALVAIEDRCFVADRLSRRNFRYMLTKANAAVLVDVHDGVLRGYVLLLFHAGTSLARLYSIAVDPRFRGLGIGEALVAAAERAALDADCVYMRLEVRKDNAASSALFAKHGYRPFGTYLDYYEDHMAAVRMEKDLAPHLQPEFVGVPYYQQTLDFTCGPAAVMMAMKALDPDIELSRQLEIRIWRESTTVFMTSGHGGCGPYGLALSAYHRCFDVSIYVNDESALFVDSVRSDEKKEVIRLVQEDFLEEIGRLPIPVHYRPLSVAEMRGEFERGGIPVVLISSYRIYKEKSPHWVVVTGFDDRFVYAHDPFVDDDKGKTVTDVTNLPILQKDFERMARYGKSGQRAVLIIRKAPTPAQRRTASEPR